MVDDFKFNLSEKIDKLSFKHKIFVFIFLLLILCSLFFMSTLDVVEEVSYKKFDKVLCTEIYINGVLNSSPCPQNTLYFPKENTYDFNFNFTNLEND
jgi:hypothetical protein